MDAKRLAYRYSMVLRKPVGFDFSQTMSVYSFGWQYDGSKGYMELCRGAIAVLEEDVDGIRIDVYSAPGASCWEEELGKLASILGINLDISDYYSMARADPLVSCIPQSLPGYRPRMLSVWSALLTAICQQNASFRQGWNMLHRLHMLASERYIVPEEHSRIFLSEPRPERIDINLLRRAGLGYRAYTVMDAIAKRAYQLSCDSISEIRNIRGVGPYTYNLVRLLACRDHSSLPLDRWLKRLASEAYNTEEREVGEVIRERFPGWAGLMALHTTIAFDAEPLSRALERLRRGLNCPGLVEPSPLTLWKYLGV